MTSNFVWLGLPVDKVKTHRPGVIGGSDPPPSSKKSGSAAGSVAASAVSGSKHSSSKAASSKPASSKHSTKASSAKPESSKKSSSKAATTKASSSKHSGSGGGSGGGSGSGSKHTTTKASSSKHSGGESAGTSAPPFSVIDAGPDHVHPPPLPALWAVTLVQVFAVVLFLGGICELIVGAIIFAEWRTVGAFWAGILAILAGVSGFLVSPQKQAGGAGTAMYVLFCIVTVIAALVGLIISDGAFYWLVTETEGNCYDASTCYNESDEYKTCEKRDCVCWVPDGTDDCNDKGSFGIEDRWCFDFKGGDCDEVSDQENLLLGSSVLLLILGITGLLGSISGCATACCCPKNV